MKHQTPRQPCRSFPAFLSLYLLIWDFCFALQPLFYASFVQNCSVLAKVRQILKRTSRWDVEIVLASKHVFPTLCSFLRILFPIIAIQSAKNCQVLLTPFWNNFNNCCGHKLCLTRVLTQIRLSLTRNIRSSPAFCSNIWLCVCARAVISRPYTFPLPIPPWNCRQMPTSRTFRSHQFWILAPALPCFPGDQLHQILTRDLSHTRCRARTSALTQSHGDFDASNSSRNSDIGK